MHGSVNAEDTERATILFKTVVPIIVERLLSEGKLEQGKLSDRTYVWSVIKDNFHILGEHGALLSV
jgi:hypothetical protein